MSFTGFSFDTILTSCVATALEIFGALAQTKGPVCAGAPLSVKNFPPFPKPGKDAARAAARPRKSQI